jgi:transcriptional regulator with XRE-family HTH domain
MTHANSSVPQINPSLSPVGKILRHWRHIRGVSQLDLAEQAEVSSRHVSFVETGKSQASRQMLLILASALEIPLQERNYLLSTAGFAPLYTQRDFHSPELAPVRRALDFLMLRQEPYPACVMDACWNLLHSNQSALKVFGYFAPLEELIGDSKNNLVHWFFFSKNLRPCVKNWEDIACMLLQRLQQDVLYFSNGTEAETLLKQTANHPDVPKNWRTWKIDQPSVLYPLHLEKGAIDLHLFSTLTTLNSTHDLTLQSLRMESYFPADEASEEALRKLVS